MLESMLSQLLDLNCMNLDLDCEQFGYSNLGETPEFEIQRQASVSHAISDQNARQKFDLECLRAAADCMQLVGEVGIPSCSDIVSSGRVNSGGRPPVHSFLSRQTFISGDLRYLPEPR
jgi:hypothetical protein